jgi:hypothetical protein
MSESDQFEAYARECIRLAGFAQNRENRERFLETARFWMIEIMNGDGHNANSASPPTSSVSRKHN